MTNKKRVIQSESLQNPGQKSFTCGLSLGGNHQPSSSSQNRIPASSTEAASKSFLCLTSNRNQLMLCRGLDVTLEPLAAELYLRTCLHISVNSPKETCSEVVCLFHFLFLKCLYKSFLGRGESPPISL